ncbi:MAG: Crp/Fnr family transcriptional regulator [Chlorobi bacterium]|nr:Crp/Fnr family transcriptional regulator [Chlorobiota bacterium]
MFCFLTEDQLNSVSESRLEVQYNKGEVIFKKGGPLTHIICISKGLAKVSLENDSGKRVLLGLVKPVEFISGPGFLIDGQHHFTVTAIEDTEACFIDIRLFKEVMSNNPDFLMELVKYLNKHIVRYFNKISNLAHKHMHGKMADTLLYLADEVYHSDTFETFLSRQDLADMSAMTKESSIRILKEFKDDGIIDFNNTRFKILKKKSLMQISKNG